MKLQATVHLGYIHPEVSVCNEIAVRLCTPGTSPRSQIVCNEIAVHYAPQVPHTEVQIVCKDIAVQCAP